MFDYKTTLNQLTQSDNGSSRLVTMIGAKNFIHSQEENFIRFRFMKGAANKANYIRITLDVSDTYTVEFGYVRGLNYKVINVTSGLYGDMLCSHFIEETGLYTTF